MTNLLIRNGQLVRKNGALATGASGCADQCCDGEGCWYRLSPCNTSIFGPQPCDPDDALEAPDLYVPCDYLDHLIDSQQLEPGNAMQWGGYCYPVSTGDAVDALPPDAVVGTPSSNEWHLGCQVCNPDPWGVCCYDIEERCSDFTTCAWTKESNCRDNLAGYWWGPCKNGEPITCASIECNLPDEPQWGCCTYYSTYVNPDHYGQTGNYNSCSIGNTYPGCTHDGGDGSCCTNDWFEYVLGSWSALGGCGCCADDAVLGYNVRSLRNPHPCFCPPLDQMSPIMKTIEEDKADAPRFQTKDILN